MWLMYQTLPTNKLKMPSFVQTIEPRIAYNNNNLQICNQSFDDVQQTRDTWMQAEGWPGVKYGLPATFSLDPSGFYMLKRDGEKVGSISLVTYPAIKFAYIGFYVVPKELRGQGLGGLLFDETVAYTEKVRGVTTFGLNCLESKSSFYAKRDFETYTIDGIWKLTAMTASTTVIPEAEILKAMPDVQFANLVNYDAAIFGTERTEFLHNFINKPGTATVVLQEQNEIKGYGIISLRSPANPEPHISYRIGPMYAQNNIVATELLDRLIKMVKLQPEQSVFLETPGTNPAAADIARQFNFVLIASMNKMYKGESPQLLDNNIFAYCSLATGG